MRATIGERAPGRAAVQRLKTRAQFQAVMAGTSVSRTAHFVLHRAEARLPAFASEDVWIGVLLPKRWARRAVTRNQMRRQIYAIGGAHAVRLPQAAHVVRLRSAFDPKVFVSATSHALRLAVRAELEQLFARAGIASPAAATP